ncbi:Sec2p domain-containing protein [Mycena kentingensis (nom. inval.)]|nr:Sec2p domain-containing protein [Mycena kentingensis (nom. inval.)]
MLHFASVLPNGGTGSNSPLVPRRSDSLNATQIKAASSQLSQQQHQLFLTVEQELHDARRVGTHGQEEDLRSALGMVIGRVVEMTTLLQEAYRSKAELEVQLNVAKSNLQLVIANNEMLEEALKSGSSNGRDVGWRRQSGTGAMRQQQHLEEGHSPNSSPTDGQGSNSRFFKTFFSSGNASNTRPATPASAPATTNGQHLTSPSLPSLHQGHSAEEEALSAALQAARATAEKAKAEAERARAEAEKMRGEKSALEEELESLSQALFEEANKMVASERKARAEAEGQLEKLKPLAVQLNREVQEAREMSEELKEARQEREALKSALRIVEGENESLRSASRMSFHGSNNGSVDLDFDGRISRSRSSSELGQKSPRISHGSPNIPSASASPEIPKSSPTFSQDEDPEPVSFTPSSGLAPPPPPDGGDEDDADGRTPKRNVVPLALATKPEEDMPEFEYDYEHVSRTSEDFSPPPTATLPSVVDPWRM